MRLFAISDLHGDGELSAAAARIARDEGAEAVLLAGDLSESGREFSGLLAPFAALGIPVLFVGGNHDDHNRLDDLAAEYGATHLDGYGTVFGGVGFIGTRGVTMGGSRQHPDEMREAFTRAARYAEAERIVSMTHTHPAGIGMGLLSRFVSPSSTIESLIHEVKPVVHVCGHLHEGAGLVEALGTTKVVNVAGAPTIIDV